MLDGYVDTLALRRGLAAARGVPSVLRALTTPWANAARGPRRRWCSPRSPRTSCWPASARPATCWCRIRRNRKLDRHLFNEAYLMHTSDQPAVRHHRQLRCGRRDDGAARWHRAGGRKHPGSAGLPPCHAQGRAGRVRQGRLVVPRSGAPRSWWKRASAARTTGSSRARPAPPSGTASASWPTASTCWTRSSRPSSRRAWTCRASSPTNGIPASIVTKFLAEHGIIVEKTGLYSFFIMFTIGITKGRWNTMLARRCSSSRTTTPRTSRCAHPSESSASSTSATSAWACATCASTPYAVRQVRHRPADDGNVFVRPHAGDEAQRCLCAHRASQDPARAHRRAEGRITTSLVTPYPPAFRC